jgi:hypothetical protein
MDHPTLGALLEARASADEEVAAGTLALRAPSDPERQYDAGRLLTDARKTGNFLRQLGVAPGRVVAIADRQAPESVLSLFGTALLGAAVRFVSIESEDRTADGNAGTETARVVLGPVGEIDRLAVDAPEAIVYGGAPDDPGTAYFERDVWSENPTFPPDTVDPRSDAFAADGQSYSHRSLLDAADRVGSEDLAGIEVVVRAPLSDPRTIAAGLLAPLACGATVVVANGDTVGDLAVCEAGRSAPEPTRIDLDDVEVDVA